MNEELILLLGDKIKTKRTQKSITLEQLANKAGVSKGLISQIENNRTVPSLPVLFNIIHSLDEDLKTFFEDMHDAINKGNVLIIRKGQEKLFEKEPVKGFSYKRILTRSIASQAVDVVLLELEDALAVLLERRVVLSRRWHGAELTGGVQRSAATFPSRPPEASQPGLGVPQPPLELLVLDEPRVP